MLNVSSVKFCHARSVPLRSGRQKRGSRRTPWPTRGRLVSPPVPLPLGTEQLNSAQCRCASKASESTRRESGRRPPKRNVTTKGVTRFFSGRCRRETKNPLQLACTGTLQHRSLTEKRDPARKGATPTVSRCRWRSHLVTNYSFLEKTCSTRGKWCSTRSVSSALESSPRKHPHSRLKPRLQAATTVNTRRKMCVFLGQRFLTWCSLSHAARCRLADAAHEE